MIALVVAQDRRRTATAHAMLLLLFSLDLLSLIDPEGTARRHEAELVVRALVRLIGRGDGS
jgi:hypothetical protein